MDENITGGVKYRQTQFAQIVHLLLLLSSSSSSSSSSFEKANLTNHSTYDSEILHVNRFSSELVHRHIIYSLTLLLLLISDYVS